MSRPSIADFVEDELLRAPLLFDAVIDVVVDEWRQAFNVAGRSGGDLSRMLQLRRNDVMAATLRSLRLLAGQRDPGGADRSAAPKRAQLSLVDENDVVADLESGRCAERIKSEAEAELREVHSYTSALVGDFAVSRETNPLRPEVFARAFWDGCQVLPAAPEVRLDAYRRAIAPLARCVRSALAAACQRLASQGVEPAAYRTLIFAPGAGTATPERVYTPPENLATLRDSMLGQLAPADEWAPLGMDDPHSPRPVAPGRRSAHAPAPRAPSPAPAPKPPVMRMMERLYAEIGAEAGLPAQVGVLLDELRPAFERVAPTDPTMIERFDHPVWRFIDRLVFTFATTPPAERARLAGLAHNLISHLVADPSPGAERFAWAIEKLEVHERQSLALAVHASADEIHRLAQAMPAAGAPGASALDVGTLDTVPGDMLETVSPGEVERGTLGPVAPGDRLRVFLQGEWRSLQLLWTRDDVWLLRDLTGGRHWALRPGVIDRLAAERLALPLRVRSLARRAAERVQASL